LSNHYTGVLQTTEVKGMNLSIDERGGELIICLRLFAASRLQVPIQQAVVNEIFKISGTTSTAQMIIIYQREIQKGRGPKQNRGEKKQVATCKIEL
jgi:hypothetical protein